MEGLSAPSREAHVNDFVLNYAYNSGKIENDAITYHDTHEVFENGRIIAFTGDVRTLFEIQNLKTSWEWARPLAVSGLQLTEDLALKAHELLTYGTYDEQRWGAGRGQARTSWVTTLLVRRQLELTSRMSLSL